MNRQQRRERAEQLARMLVQPSKAAYEKLRAEWIAELGYDEFRALQVLAFEYALYGVCEQLKEVRP